MKKVYIALTADFIHHGHINLIEKASFYGDVFLGLLTDKAISSNKDLPYLNYAQRLKIISNLKGIKKVVPQNEWDYSKNIITYAQTFKGEGEIYHGLYSNLTFENPFLILIDL